MNARGMTLLEVLIAITLGLVLLGSVTSFAWSQLDARRQILEAADARRSVTLVIDRLEQDLISAIAASSDGIPGVEGETSAISVLSRGVSPSWTEDPATMVGDLHRLVIRFRPTTGEIEMNRGSVAGSDQASILPGRLLDLQFRYFDGQSWQSAWNSLDMNGLPTAVEVRCWYGRPEVEAEDALSESFAMDSEFSDESMFEREDADAMPDRIRIILIPDATSMDTLEGEDP